MTVGDEAVDEFVQKLTGKRIGEWIDFSKMDKKKLKTFNKFTPKPQKQAASNDDMFIYNQLIDPTNFNDGLQNAALTPVSEREGKQVNKNWADIYKPRRSPDLLGNYAEIGRLRTWLQEWYINSKNAGKKDAFKRAALVSGPPGIGKTTAAVLLARELGYEVVI